MHDCVHQRGGHGIVMVLARATALFRCLRGRAFLGRVDLQRFPALDQRAFLRLAWLPSSLQCCQIRQKTTSGFGPFLTDGLGRAHHSSLGYLALTPVPPLSTVLARPAGVEPATYGFEVRHSIH